MGQITHLTIPVDHELLEAAALTRGQSLADFVAGAIQAAIDRVAAVEEFGSRRPGRKHRSFADRERAWMLFSLSRRGLRSAPARRLRKELEGRKG